MLGIQASRYSAVEYVKYVCTDGGNEDYENCDSSCILSRHANDSSFFTQQSAKSTRSLSILHASLYNELPERRTNMPQDCSLLLPYFSDLGSRHVTLGRNSPAYSCVGRNVDKTPRFPKHISL